MNRRLLPYLLSAIVLSFLAAWSYLKDPSLERMGRSWQLLETREIQEISLIARDKEVHIKPLGQGLAWAEVQKPKAEKEMFLVGERLRDVMFHLSPIWSNRDLGKITAKKIRDYGFEENGKKLMISLPKQDPLILMVGTRGFRSDSYFTLDPSHKEIFLWDRTAVDLLSDPARMAIRSPVFFDPEALNRIEIRDMKVPERSLGLNKFQKVWRQGESVVAAEDPAIGFLEALSKVGIQGYRQAPLQGAEAVLSFLCDLETTLRVTLLYEKSADKYWLDLGGGYPQILLDRSQMDQVLGLWTSQKKS